MKRIVKDSGRAETETILRDYDIAGSLDALTEGESKQLLRFKDLDGPRVRIDDAGMHKEANPLGPFSVSICLYER